LIIWLWQGLAAAVQGMAVAGARGVIEPVQVCLLLREQNIRLLLVLVVQEPQILGLALMAHPVQILCLALLLQPAVVLVAVLLELLEQMAVREVVLLMQLCQVELEILLQLHQVREIMVVLAVFHQILPEVAAGALAQMARHQQVETAGAGVMARLHRFPAAA
jgi:hypothetical protein